MFKALSEKISKSIKKIIHVKYLTEKKIENTLNEVRVSLLEGDVALPVINDFIYQVRKNITEKNINKYLNPGHECIKIIFSSLVRIIKKGIVDLNLNPHTLPAIILIVGPQGSGKTTTVGKLAKFLNEKKNKKILITSVDTYRPAGSDQLKTLVYNEKNINFFSDFTVMNKPTDILKKAIIASKLQHYDVLLIDTVGCLDTDHKLLAELNAIYKIVNPIETLFVIDSMIGQVAINSVMAFDKVVPLTGIILTKLDGDVRGGIALSITHTTNKPIKFIGTGEKIVDLEPFYPDRIASRILGMGDIASLIEDIEVQVSLKKQRECMKKYNVEFNLYDFLNHIKQIRQIGGVNKIIDKLPSFLVNVSNTDLHLCDEKLIYIEAMINAMTAEERCNPVIITESRKKRIATGSGVKVRDVTNLLNKFNDTRIMVQKMNKKNIFSGLNILKNKVFSKFSEH